LDKTFSRNQEMSRNGHHAVTFDDDSTYTGAWRDDKRHGQGTNTWADGNSYTGAWRDGKKHRHGTFTWASGNSYTGAMISSSTLHEVIAGKISRATNCI